MVPDDRGTALLVYDGECVFCRAWIERWKRWTRGRIACLPFQQAAVRFAEIPPERFNEAVQLILPEGVSYSGVHAILWTFAFSRHWSVPLWAYERLPGVAWCADKVYGQVARHRGCLAGRVCAVESSHRDTGSAAKWAGWLPLALLPVGVVVFSGFLQPWAFMCGLAISIYFGLKWLSWWKARYKVRHAAWRSMAYLLAWPGMDAESFLDARKCAAPPRLRAWCGAALETGLGAVLLWAGARAVPPGEPLLRGWIGMAGVIFLLHFGAFQILALFWQSLGVDAAPIMSAPLRSKSLGDFWGKRWNLGFRQLSHDLIFRPLCTDFGVATAGFLAFVTSGLVHDVAISLPARGGYGLPTAYFALQGLGVAFERSRFGKRLGLGKGVRGWVFMAVFTAGPAFWLFHPPFVLRVMIPLMKKVHAL